MFPGLSTTCMASTAGREKLPCVLQDDGQEHRVVGHLKVSCFLNGQFIGRGAAIGIGVPVFDFDVVRVSHGGLPLQARCRPVIRVVVVKGQQGNTTKSNAKTPLNLSRRIAFARSRGWGRR